ncbi:MAG: hypothetical protein WA892_11385 [Ornithinimicrobium sp.]
MKSYSQILTISFVISMLIVAMSHFTEVAGYFSLSAAALSALKWGLTNQQEIKSQAISAASHVAKSYQGASKAAINYFPEPEPLPSALAGDEVTEAQIGTVVADPWDAMPLNTSEVSPAIVATEAVEGVVNLSLSEPMLGAHSYDPATLAAQEVMQETSQVTEVDDIQALTQQLESLPKKGRKARMTWSSICKALSIAGGTKLRDANPTAKAQFLQSKNVTVLQLVKAKVLTLKAAV